MRQLLSGRVRVAVLVVVVLGLTAGGIAYASIPDASGVIHGCYLTKNGSLRVIQSPGGACVSGETALNWSQTGPKGATGARGTAGTNGTNGATGPTGPMGPSGSGAALWANVSKDGTVWAQHGVLTTNALGAGLTGQYLVQFNRDVSHCSWIASRSVSQGVSDYNPNIEVTAFGLGSFYPPPANQDLVEVETLNNTGGGGGQFANQAFSLAVVC
jgi:hypothetical protein